MVEIKNLDKTYKGRGGNSVHAINGVSLTLPDSGVVAVFGKSGCGKTTLLNVIGGLDKADGGSVLLDGARITPDADAERNFSVGYIFQNYNLSKNMTVFENVASSLRLCGVSDEGEIRERVSAALSEVEMDKYAGRMTDALSGGQQQRVAIARAIVKRPKLILADEPTGNLDEHNTVLVMDILREISKDCLVLLVTHEAELVDLYCDRVIEVVDGSVVGDRQNVATGGFEGRAANEVYLGDMERAELASPDFSVELFGDRSKLGKKLRIISRGGTLYVEAAGFNVKSLERGGDLHVHEGKFAEREKRRKKPVSSVLKSAPTVGKAGRMYSFKAAVRSGFRNNFGRARLGKKALFLGLVSFAVIIVLMVSSFGTVFHKMNTVMENFNENTVFIDAVLTDKSELKALLESGAADHVATVFLSADMPPRAISNYSFSIGNFESFADAEAGSFEAKATPVPISAMGEPRLVAGVAELTADDEFIITTALADKLLLDVSVSYITSYERLLDAGECKITTNNGSEKGVFESIYPTSRLVGIVEGDEMVAYHTDYAVLKSDLAAITTKPEYLDIYTTHSVELGKIENGSVYLSLREYEDAERYYANGIVINGMSFTVAGFFDPVDDRLDELNAFIKAQGGPDTPLDLGTNFESYLSYLKIKAAFDTENNRYDAEKFKAEFPADYKRLYGEWLTQCEKWRQDYYTNVRMICPKVFFTFEDLKELSYSSGKTENHLENTFASKSEYALYRYYGIHSANAEELFASLVAKYGTDGIYNSDVFYDYYSADYKEDTIRLTACLVVVFAVMALSLYLIMRSALFADIKEVGIARAIGVGRKNLVFRYFVETLVVFSLTVLPGFLVTSLVVSLLMGASSYVYDFLYYPFYLALPAFAAVLAVNVVCGILPILLLLRKTPASILSKYDI